MAPRAFEIERVRADFPALRQPSHGFRLAYLDNAATTQLPEAVIERVARVGRRGRANVHRGVHSLSEQRTAEYEAARARAQAFVNAREAREIVFVRGATEAVNLVAASFGRPRLAAGDEILVTGMEHHSNLVPWQMLCEERGARLSVVPVDEAGEIDAAEVERRIGPRTRLLAVTHASNAIGTVNPIREIADAAHARSVPVLVDGAQAAAHLEIDVAALGADFYVFSGHKLYGPTGIGVLYGRAELLEEMPPFLAGGEMVSSVSLESARYAELPHKFEAGTPNLEGALGLHAALDYLASFDRGAIARHEAALLAECSERLARVPGVRLIGTARRKLPIVSFVLDGVHAHDLGSIADRHGVAIRTGHHCAEPLVRRFGVPATARASFALYNDRDDIDALLAAIEQAKKVFGG